jgi:gas vesicle protein GvpN
VNTVLQARPRNFVSTPTLERTALRALRYLQSGYSVHLKGPAGTGKTTLALHLADLLGRPIMLLFGDDEFKTSDLIGNQSGYTRKKVVDNYIHSVMKVEDELRHNWIDSRLTLACREGFTLVYDEFNRSRPEVNNVLLSALEEKLLVLPPNQNRSEYIRVNPHFRAIFTSNPEEYCGVHGTQDALQDRLITINMPEPDELAQQQILVQKVGIDTAAALQIVRLVKIFQADAAPDMVSSLRPSLMIATICNDHGIPPLAENAEFRDVCSDVLLDRSKHPLPEATRRLWDLFNQFVASQTDLVDQLQPNRDDSRPIARLHGEEDESGEPVVAAAVGEIPAPLTDDVAADEAVDRSLAEPETEIAQVATEGATEEQKVAEAIAGASESEPELEPVVLAEEVLAEDDWVEPAIAVLVEDCPTETATLVEPTLTLPPLEPLLSTLAAAALNAPAPQPPAANIPAVLNNDDIETRIFDFLDGVGSASFSRIETDLGLTRFQVVNALKSMLDQSLIEKGDDGEQPSVYQIRSERG